MKVSALCNLVGSGLVTMALIFHIVCVATPYYFNADLSKLKEDIKGVDLPAEELHYLLTIAEAEIKINNGLWKVCYTAKLAPDGDCKSWDDKVNPGDWLKGAQAMGILGVLVMAGGAVFAIINLVVQSRGDRLRLFPYLICGLCCFGGVLTLCCDAIVAAKYKTEVDLPNEVTMSSTIKDILRNEFYLNWGFGLDIVAIVFSCLGGLIHIFAGRQSDMAGLV